MNKVILISIDGLRPDGLLACGNPYVDVLLRECAHCLGGKTVFPSVTLPCHMSMFHSVPPERHGILTNLYMPQVRPVPGIFETVSAAGGRCAFFYNWDELRDIARPGSLAYSFYRKMEPGVDSDRCLTRQALDCIRETAPDFLFLYLGQTDEEGHSQGWMSPAYLRCVSDAISCVRQVIESCGEDYSVIITADHGGHDRTHGTQLPEDMTIPLLFRGGDFPGGRKLEQLSILDIAPTVLAVMGLTTPADWEGKSRISQ